MQSVRPVAENGRALEALPLDDELLVVCKLNFLVQKEVHHVVATVELKKRRIVVDGVVSSTHTTAVHPRLAAALLVPLRWTAAALGMRWSTPANRLNLLARGACGLSWVTDSMPRGPQRLSSAIA
jgi:hypothetical protein